MDDESLSARLDRVCERLEWNAIVASHPELRGEDDGYRAWTIGDDFDAWESQLSHP